MVDIHDFSFKFNKSSVCFQKNSKIVDAWLGILRKINQVIRKDDIQSCGNMFHHEQVGQI